MSDLMIEKRNGAMVWKQEVKKPDKNMIVRVPDGCVALAFAGNVFLNEYRDGDNGLFNQDGRLSKQYKHSDFGFIVFNREKPATVKWGVGKTPVTYEDRKLGGIALGVRAYGHCDVVVHDASLLWEKLPDEYTDDGVVKPEEIEAFLQKEIIAKIAPIISQQLSEIGDYTKVTSSVNEISDKIRSRVPNLENMGVHISNVVIENISFTDESQEIIEKHKESKVAKLDTEIMVERAKQINSILDAVNGREDN